MNQIKPTSLILTAIRKTYPAGIEALRGISMEVRPGEVFGLVGPNGAGKSTLLKIASGLLFPGAGSVFCGETDITRRPKQAAAFIGLMPDPLGVYTDISAREYLEFFARLQEVPADRIDAVVNYAVDLLGLQPWLNDEVETLSAGWQRRLALGRVLLADTPILLLDEPAAGLDVSARSELLGLVRTLAQSGRTLVVSSHILPELQQLADRFAIINQGRWVTMASGRPFFTRSELQSGFAAAHWQMRCNRPADAILALARHALNATLDGDSLSFTAADEITAAGGLKAVIESGVTVFDFHRQQVELTELVLQVLQSDNQQSGPAPAHRSQP
ncbi:MAG: ABC transporter ATP-binding protein [bacterium]